MATSEHFITCPLCEATCGLQVTIEDDAVKRIRGDMADPFSKGFICPKGSTLKQLHEDPDRLRAPVVKRDGRFVEVSWDEAFAEIAQRLGPIVEEHGRDSLGFCLGNPSVHNLAGLLYPRAVMQAAGTRNIFSASTVDQMPKHVTCGLMWGDPLAFPLPDLDRTDHLLILGANPYASNGSLVTAPDFPGRLEAIIDRGGKVVVIDPRRTKTAAEASEHHPIRPGTDAWLLLAMIHVLFRDGLVTIGRLEPHVSGVDEVRELVAPITPERAAAATGIDVATIEGFARELAAAPAAAVYGRMGAHTVAFGALTSWATDVLNILTGNLDRPGGIMFGSPPWIRISERDPGGRGYSVGRWASRVRGLPEVNGELPAVTLADEIEGDEEGRIRALVLMAANPVRSFPNSERLDAALGSLDLLVAVDPYVNESTCHADVILPPRSALERSHFDFAFLQNTVRVVTKWNDPVLATEHPDDAEVFARLALVIGGFGADADPELIHEQLLGYFVDQELRRPDSPIADRDRADIIAELADRPPAERVVDFRIRTGRFGDGFGAEPDGLTLERIRADHPHGIDHGPLVERMPAMIKTASGTIELAPPPIIAEAERFHAEAAANRRDSASILLIGRRHLRSNNSWMHNVKVLVKGKERCTLQVNPGDAERLGLSDGGRATVTSRVGSVEAPVEVTDEVMMGVVSLPHGWGHDSPGARLSVAAEHAGVNSNALTDDAVRDHLSGNAVLNAIPVEVGPAG